MVDFATYFAREQRTREKYTVPWYEARGWRVIDEPTSGSFDLLLEKNDVRQRVEEKFLMWGGAHEARPRLLVELVQCAVEKSWGWFHTEHFDFLHYFPSRLEDDVYLPLSCYRVNWCLTRPLIHEYLGDTKQWRSHGCRIHHSAEGWGATLFMSMPFDRLEPGTWEQIPFVPVR
jgi:hypothetical protein